MNYSIRSGVVASGELSDRVLVYNAEYGDLIGKFGSRPVTPDLSWFRKLEKKNGFFTKLEKSILDEGFRNPIYCTSITEGTFCIYGSSRLWIAQKNKLDIPVIISDYVGAWDSLEELKTIEDILKKFKDPPEILEFSKEEMFINGCPHSHIGET